MISWLLAAAARWCLRRVGRTDWIARLMSRTGLLTGLTELSLDELASRAGRIIYWLVFMLGAALALATVSEYAARRLLEFLPVLLPKALNALCVLWASKWLAGYWSRSTLIVTANEGLPYPWRWAGFVRAGTLFAGIALASELTGFGTLIVRSAFLILLAGTVVLCILVLAPVLRAHLSHQAGEQPPHVDESCR